MFTTEHFRRPSLHETISRLCLRQDQTRTVLTLLTFMPLKSTEMSIAGTKNEKKKKKNQHVAFFFVGYVGIEEPEHLRMR